MERRSRIEKPGSQSAEPPRSRTTRLDADMPQLVERDGRLVIVIPMKLKRIGGRKVIILPRGSGIANQTDGHSSPVQKPLVLALARAHLWKELLEQEHFATVAELAEAVGLDRAYVGRVLKLTLLAPEIILAILDGCEPSGLSLEKLLKPMPMGWDEQIVALGFLN